MEARVQTSRIRNGFMAALLTVPAIVAFHVGWGIKSCAIADPAFVLYYAVFGPLFSAFVTVPTIIVAFAIGCIARLRFKRSTIILGCGIAVILALFFGYHMRASGCSPV